MKERNESSGVSAEVIGQFSEMQKAEYAYIGSQIADGQGLDPKNPDEVAIVATVIDDCIRRGLQANDRAWFTPNESIISVFDTGLSEREKVAAELLKLYNDTSKNRYLSKDEVNAFENGFGGDKPTVLSPYLQDYERYGNLYQERRLDIQRYQDQLYGSSGLGAEVERLRRVQKEFDPTEPREDVDMMVYRNYLLHLAVYNSPGVAIDPKDIAAIADLWRTQEARERGTVRILERVDEIGARQGADEIGVRAYTEYVLRSFDLYTGGVDPNLDHLKAVPDFIIPPELFYAEEEEFAPERSRIPLTVTQEEYEKARGAFVRLSELTKAADDDALTLDEDALSSDDPFDKVIEFYSELGGLDIIYLVYGTPKTGLTRPQEQDLEELVPIDPYIEALQFSYGQIILVEETGENAIQIPQREQEKVYTLIKKHVQAKISSSEEELGEIVQDLPVQFIEECLAGHIFSPDQLTIIAQQPDAVLLQICKEAHVGVDSDPYRSASLRIDVPFEYDDLETIIASLPKARQDALALQLKKVISL